MATTKNANPAAPARRPSAKGGVVKRDAKTGTFVNKGGQGKSSTPRLTLVNGRKVYTSAAEPVRITREQIERAVASLKK